MDSQNKTTHGKPHGKPHNERQDKMYRNYENPRELERLLEEEKARQAKRVERGEELDELDLERIEGLKERINFAWQDDEYDAMQASY